MKRTVLKDEKFHIIGYIEEDNNGKQVLKDDKFRIRGYYDPKTNVTKDAKFHIVGYGNLLTSLLDD